MAKDRALVRASDIGTWAFCGRAWYLAQVREVAHASPEQLARGTAAHVAHGQQVRRAAQTTWVGRLLLAVAALLGVAALAAALWAWLAWG